MGDEGRRQADYDRLQFRLIDDTCVKAIQSTSLPRSGRLLVTRSRARITQSHVSI